MTVEAEPLEEAYEPELMSGFGRAAVAEAKPDIPAPEPIVAEPVPSLPAVPRSDMVLEVPKVREIIRSGETPRSDQQPFSDEKIEELAKEMALVSGSLSKVSDAIGLLQKTVSDLNAEILSIKNVLALSKETHEKDSAPRDTKEMKDLQRQQREVAGLLTEVLDLLSSLKEKKSWFRL